MRLTLLIPSLNEVDGIRETLRRIPREALRSSGYELDVLVIDGASTDGTAEAARALGARVHVEPRKGYGRAYKTGFGMVTADVVVTADADDTYPLDRLPEFLAEFRSRGLDFATLDRFRGMRAGSMRPKHRFGNAVLTWTTRALFRVRIRDSQSGMWILDRRALQRLPFESMGDGMAFSQEVKIHAFRDGELRSAELAGGYYPRIGQVKLSSWGDGTRNLASLVRRRFRRTKDGAPGHGRS